MCWILFVCAPRVGCCIMSGRETYVYLSQVTKSQLKKIRLRLEAERGSGFRNWSEFLAYCVYLLEEEK